MILSYVKLAVTANLDALWMNKTKYFLVIFLMFFWGEGEFEYNLLWWCKRMLNNFCLFTFVEVKNQWWNFNIFVFLGHVSVLLSTFTLCLAISRLYSLSTRQWLPFLPPLSLRQAFFFFLFQWVLLSLELHVSSLTWFVLLCLAFGKIITSSKLVYIVICDRTLLSFRHD